MAPQEDCQGKIFDWPSLVAIPPWLPPDPAAEAHPVGKQCKLEEHQGGSLILQPGLRE